MWFYTYWRQGDAHTGDRVDGLGHRTLAIATHLHDVYLTAKCLGCFAVYRMAHTRFQEARTACAQLLALGKEARNPRTTAMGLWALAFVDVLEERFEEAIERTEEALRLSPDLLDRLTAQGVKGMALALRGQAQEGRAILHEVRKEIMAGEYLFPLMGFDIPYGVTLVLTGQMAAGVCWIEETMQRFGALGTTTQYAWGHLFLGEIYLQMALGQTKLPLRLLLRNLRFILRTLPRAARKAQYHLNEAIRRARALEMPGVLARALLDLSMFYQSRKRMAAARISLEETRDITERWASPPMQAKICAALASLNDLASP
jgi:tetratricopeptide (TPR) repeat protein